MTLEQRLIALAQVIGADIKALNLAQGSLSTLATTAKDSLVAAVNELKTAVDAGPVGAPGKDGQIRFTGAGAPPALIVGASPDDTYLDTETGHIYTLN